MALNRLLPLALCALLACGSSGVAFTLRDPSGSVSRVPATSARLDAAERQLQELVGRRVQLQIDAALLPTSVAAFTDAYADVAEGIAGMLTSLRDQNPDAFAQLGRSLTRVELRYDGTLERAEATYQDGVLQARAATSQASVRELRGALYFALVDRYSESEGRDLYRTDPQKVPAERQQAYFDALVHFREYEEPAPTSAPWDPKGAVVRSDPRGRALQKLIAFHATLPPGELRSNVELHIVENGGSYVSEPYRRYNRDAGLRAPADSVLAQSKAAYLRWLGANLDKLDDKAKHKAALSMFSREDEVAAEAYRGFDRLGWGLSMYERWLALTEPAPAFGLLDDIVCPYNLDGDNPTRMRSCSTSFYRTALADDDSAQRFLRFVRTHDKRVLINAVANLRYQPPPRLLELLRALDDNPPLRNAGLRALADLYGRDGRLSAELQQEGYDLYKRRVDARGAALYLLLSTRPHGGLQTIASSVQPPIGAAELQDLLALSPRALDDIAAGWSALRFAKARVIASALSSASKTETVMALARAACAEGNPAELAELRRGMENAARASSVDRARYDGALEMLNSCTRKAR